MTAATTAEKAQAKDVSTEVNSLAVDDMQLAGISTAAEIASLLGSENVQIEDYPETYSSGFLVTKDKTPMVGKPCMFLQWRFGTSDTYHDDNGNPAPFVSAYVATLDANGNIDGKYIINDGSVGIYAQLRRITDTRLRANHPQAQAGLVVRHGLRVSEYDTVKDGKQVHGTTYYLA